MNKRAVVWNDLISRTKCGCVFDYRCWGICWRWYEELRDKFRKFSEQKQPTTLALQNGFSNMFHQTSGSLWSFLYLLKLQTGSQQACSQMFRHWKILIFDFFLNLSKYFSMAASDITSYSWFTRFLVAHNFQQPDKYQKECRND